VPGPRQANGRRAVARALRGTGATILAIVAILAILLFGLKALKVIGTVVLVFAILLAIPVVLGMYFVWRMKRRMRRSIERLQEAVEQAQMQAGAGMGRGGPARARRPDDPDVIDVQPTSVRDDHR